MPPDPDALSLTPEDPLREVARVLAAGVLRLRDRPALPALSGRSAPPENFPESSPARLEVPGETVLTVQRG